MINRLILIALLAFSISCAKEDSSGAVKSKAPIKTTTNPPVPPVTVTPNPPVSDCQTDESKRSGALCKDGTKSTATGKGACSRHGGVERWLCK